MDEIAREQEQILEEFRQMEDGFGRYSYLLGLAGLMPPYPEEFRTKESLVEGCQSSVWLHTWAEEGRFRVLADSDTYVIKGLLYLLMNVLDDRPLGEAAEAKLYFWRDPMLMGSFDEHRKKGIGLVAARLQREAAALQQSENRRD